MIGAITVKFGAKLKLELNLSLRMRRTCVATSFGATVLGEEIYA